MVVHFDYRYHLHQAIIELSAYQHLFFDLDRTLWDFDTNARLTLEQIFIDFGLAERGIPSAAVFIATYNEINDKMWAEYREGRLDKGTLRTARYAQTLRVFNIDDDALGTQIGEVYINESPRKTNLFPFAHELLTYLQDRYTLHIITNGFSEVQAIKLAESKLEAYFDVVVTSELAGQKKPHPDIFSFALERAGATAGNSLMIGDDLEVDIIGAHQVGWDQVYFNPNAMPHTFSPTYEVRSLQSLIDIL